MVYLRAAGLWMSLALSALVPAAANAQTGPSVPMAYCAGINTSPNAANTSDFQSDGLCYGFCVSDWAFAIVQGKLCWCSDYIPDQGDQVSTGQCSNSCPGYPTDVCGGNNLFGYMALKKSPSGTSGSNGAGGSSSSVKTTSSAQSSSGSSTVSTSTSPSSTMDTRSMAPTPSASVQTFTAGGTVKTVTITPTPASTDSSGASGSTGGLPTGAAVGIAVGVIIAVGLILGALIWVWCRKRKQNAEAADGPFDSPSQRGSSAGMASTPKTGGAMSESRYVMGSDGQSMADTWENGKRRSTLMPVDPRLDPFARGIYNNTQNSRSHESVGSLQDNQDYSRRVHEPTKVLRATNPDPED